MRERLSLDGPWQFTPDPELWDTEHPRLYRLETILSDDDGMPIDRRAERFGMRSMPDHHRQWQEWVQAFAARPAWTFAREYAGIERWRSAAASPGGSRPGSSGATG
jgi:hypothetical protein